MRSLSGAGVTCVRSNQRIEWYGDNTVFKNHRVCVYGGGGGRHDIILSPFITIQSTS